MKKISDKTNLALRMTRPASLRVLNSCDLPARPREKWSRDAGPIMKQLLQASGLMLTA